VLPKLTGKCSPFPPPLPEAVARLASTQKWRESTTLSRRYEMELDPEGEGAAWGPLFCDGWKQIEKVVRLTWDDGL
jgi:hypothetical protein